MINLGSLGVGGKNLPLDTVDNKGVVWWLGTQGETASFVNPHTAGYVTASWVGNGTGVPADTVNRVSGQNVHTTDTQPGWWKIDIGTNNASRRLLPSHMRVQNRGTDPGGHLPTNGIIQGSNNNTNWTTIGGFSTGTFVSGINAWTTLQLTNIHGSFRYFYFAFTTVNSSNYWYNCEQEYELFGLLTE